MKQDIAHRAVCQNCGNSDFEWGWIHPTALDRQIKYTVDSKSSWLGLAGINLKARRCTGCGHLELFAVAEGSGSAEGGVGPSSP
jgi:hypothetical protein